MSIDLDSLVQAVHKSAKYRNVCDDAIRNIGARELARRKTLSEAVDETKNTLHQIGGAYFDGRLAAGESAALLNRHASTRERLPMAGEFYARIFEHIPQPRSLLDVACGLNPLLIEHMPLSRECEYVACDIYLDLVDAINAHFATIGQRGTAIACDASVPAAGAAAAVFAREYDVAFLFKCLTCLEPIDRAAPLRLLDAVRARHIVISYPAASLGGHKRGMRETNAAKFAALATGRNWQHTRLDFANELVFVVGPTP
jgi:16S rRNA (guanine(1405)-N(7))-methyltransferase